MDMNTFDLHSRMTPLTQKTGSLMQAILNVIMKNGPSHDVEHKEDVVELLTSDLASYSETMTQQVEGMLQR